MTKLKNSLHESIFRSSNKNLASKKIFSDFGKTDLIKKTFESIEKIIKINKNEEILFILNTNRILKEQKKKLSNHFHKYKNIKFIFNRCPGGIFTNFKFFYIKNNKIKIIKKIIKSVKNNKKIKFFYKKYKEIKKKNKLPNIYKLPWAIITIDPNENRSLIKESLSLGIKVIYLQ